MFSLQNELDKRLEIINQRKSLLDERELLDERLREIDKYVSENPVEELELEVAEIKKLMGINEEEHFEEVVSECEVEQNIAE